MVVGLAFTYHPKTDSASYEFTSSSIPIMAVDNLPCELPKESSTSFSKTLKAYIPAIVKANYEVEFENLSVPREIKDAIIVHNGKLTPKFQYLEKFIQ